MRPMLHSIGQKTAEETKSKHSSENPRVEYMDCQIIRGNTRLVGLFGYPVAHSVSPVFQNHAFRKLDLPFVYIPLEVKPENIQTAVGALKVMGFAGANVTIPHKRAVMQRCDHVSDISRLTGTVNTLYFDNDRLWGTTTDPQGFYGALRWMGHEPRGGNIVILGNGGTARTLGFSLALKKIPATLTLVGRNEDRVGGLAKEITEKTGFPVQWTLFSNASLRDRMEPCALCVNCTSLGMHPRADVSPLEKEMLHPTMTVVDAIYNPPKTKLLAMAEEKGCTIQNGLRMLLYQGLASFTYWTGANVPEDIFDMEELERLVVHK
ncbi:MAG: shikimate dehydrogenase [Chitinivibrionales bacterium]|nr:shikimate dehydrogenase [Chitinivibrionales bacterium]